MSDNNIEPYKEGLIDRIIRIGDEDGIVKDIIKPFVLEQFGQLLHQITDYYFFDKKASGYSKRSSSGIEVVDYRGASEKNSGSSKVSTASSSKKLIERSFDTQAQARTVLDSLKVTLQEYGEVRVQDYYRVANIQDRNFELANKWGWRDEFKATTIVRKGLKWYLDLPPIKWLEAEDKK